MATFEGTEFRIVANGNDIGVVSVVNHTSAKQVKIKGGPTTISGYLRFHKSSTILLALGIGTKKQLNKYKIMKALKVKK